MLMLLFLITLQTLTNIVDQNTSQPLIPYYSPTNFTANSTYQSNLNLLIRRLIATASDTGFAASSQGNQQTGQVFGASLCRFDALKDQCKQCLSDAANVLQQNFPLSNTAVVWEDKCMLRYSSTSLSFDQYISWFNYECSDTKANDVQAFETTTRTLVEELAQNVAYNSSGKFATGEANYSSSSTVYTFMQCARDTELTEDECYKCLLLSLGYASGYCWGRQGVVVATFSCFIRFETFSFYDQTALKTNSSSILVPPPTRPDFENSGIGSSPAGRGRGLHRYKRLFVIITPIICTLLCILAIRTCLRRRKCIASKSITGRSRDLITEDLENRQPKTQSFKLSFLRNVTNNFSYKNKLGEDGFGAVYKGVLANGMEIIVKRLSETSKQGLMAIRNDIMFVAKLQHKNLARLVGFCLEEKEKLLVYEFLANQSLDKFLFDSSKCGELDWKLRYAIIEGIAKGLLYLHEDSQLIIVHCDLKASNVLLDHNMNAKLSDIGLARFFTIEKSCESACQLAGANQKFITGYKAPEHALNGDFTTKSDVYSYGVLMLEIITGRKVTDFHGPGKDENLLNYAWNVWNNKRGMDMVDPSLGDLHNHELDVLRCIQISLLCVQQEPTQRPNITSVIMMLNSAYSPTLPTPNAPDFSINASTSEG